ncbi:MAG: hypothetical protein M5U26_09780 [Planctomycetota bacterium]|nr:hypothetical protein [Planctomycetota bacterium]
MNGNIERVEPPPSRPKPPEEPIASIGPGPQVRPEPAVSVVPPVTSPIETKTEAAPAATLDPMQALTGRDTSSPKRVEEDEEEPGPAMVQNPAAREPAPAPTTPAVEPPLDLKPLPQDPKPEVAQPQPAQPVQPPQPAPPPAEPAKPSLADQYATIPHVPFVHLEKDPAPPLQAWIPWNFGPKYAGKRDTNVLLEDAKRVFEEAQRKHESWEKMTSLELVRVDTHHVTVHARLTEALARGVGQKLEDLTGLLQRDTRSVALTQTRPDTHELVILWDDIDYNKLIDAFEKQQPGEHWKLARMATGGMSRYTGYFNARQGLPPGPEHMALFQFGKLLILEATDGKAPAWLNEGFAALGENMVTHQNLCYSFRYEPNAVKFGENWNQDIRKFAMESKLKTWDLIFPLDLVGMSSLDYLTCYSMVSYLYKASPAMFLKLVDNIRNGMDSKTAVEKAYGRPLKDIQQMWGQWALQQR